METTIEKKLDALWRVRGRAPDEREKALLRRALLTLYGNIIPAPALGTLPWGTRRAIAPAMPRYVGHWNWDSAFSAMALARIDAPLAREQAGVLFAARAENGCLPNVIFPDGRVAANRSQPPVWFCAYREIDRRNPDDAALADAYGVLCRYEAFWRTRRQTGGLFRYDADEGKNASLVKFESGWDTSPRWDETLPDALWPIDLNCYMVEAYRSLAYMAKRLGRSEAQRWTACAETLAALINERLWHEESGAYMDTVIADGRPTGVLTPASFMPLAVGIADAARAEKTAALARSPQKFYPLMPSVSYDAPQYASGDYFRGPTWMNLAGMALDGLHRYGYTALAAGYRERLLGVCAAETRGLFEYYDSRTGEGRGACGYGWTAAFLIHWILDF